MAACKADEGLIGLPERKPEALLADKGYNADAIRADLAERKIEAVIPGKSNCRVKIEHDRALHKHRNRTIATRHVSSDDIGIDRSHVGYIFRAYVE